MGLRFSKRVKVLPGVTLNLSKSGVSTSLGVRGARVTVGHGRTRKTVGVPGTGLSFSEVRKTQPDESPGAHWFWGLCAIAALIALAKVFS